MAEPRYRIFHPHPNPRQMLRCIPLPRELRRTHSACAYSSTTLLPAGKPVEKVTNRRAHLNISFMAGACIRSFRDLCWCVVVTVNRGGNSGLNLPRIQKTV